MDIKKNDFYLKLQEEAEKAGKEFYLASDKLRKGYFYEIDKKVEEIEYEIKEKFLTIADKEMRDSLISFRFHYDPKQILFRAPVKIMNISNLLYDLDNLVSKFPIEDRNDHNFLKQTNVEYKETLAIMKEKLIEFGLHPLIRLRDAHTGKIRKFLDDNNIFGFVPEYYKD